MSGLGNSMDVPFEENPPGQFITDEFLLSGGVVVAAAVVPVGDETKPALIFRFSNPFGEFYSPVALVLDDDQAAKVTDLVSKAVTCAVNAAKERS